MKSKFLPSILSFSITALLLGLVQTLPDSALLVSERFIPGAGWVQILLVSTYAAFLCYKMLYSANRAYWRKVSWMVFSIVFFNQLLLGIFLDERFLMTGNLHLPIPMVILGGSLYRFQIGFMPILFLSTIALSGSAWCSHLCYFGAFDFLAASNKKGKNTSIKHKTAIKYSLLLLIIVVSLLLKLFQVSNQMAIILALVFGIIGLVIIVYLTRKAGKMIHCTLYCPIGSIVNVIGKINPYRIKITSSCNSCMACTPKCKYDALSIQDIKSRKPAYTCTNCGDCISSCHTSAIKYKFLKWESDTVRTSYFIIVVVIHTLFLALARI